jgi:beta-glucosidase
MNTFGKGFVWGAATCAYQIEGAHDIDGKGESIWDYFCKIPQAVWGGHNGNTACDHYHRFNDDVQLMKKMGLQAYRTSISWPRILPQGTGAVNKSGLEFYDRLIDSLLNAGITPYITLYHWDLPLHLHRLGGWHNPQIIDWFAEYTSTVVNQLSDRVENWITFNEPDVFIGHGYQLGIHAPGLKLPFTEILNAGHNVMKAHGKAVQVIRANSKKPCKIGYAPSLHVKIPMDNSPEAIELARKVTFDIKRKDTWNIAWWLDPLVLGKYPDEANSLYAQDMPVIGSNDMKLISEPIDFIGVNIYQGSNVTTDSHGNPQLVNFPNGYPQTSFDWPVVPESLRWGPRFLHDRYKKPIFITENGMANRDWVFLDGKVHDPSRIDFTTRYLIELQKAISDGAQVQGYFHWSLMDNFEWAEGYKQRFGMIHVDFQTQKRILKDSALWYKEVIESNGGILFNNA